MNAATARSSSTIANTRCRLAAREREAGDEQRRRDRRAETEPCQRGSDQGERLRGRELYAEDCDSGREEDHPDQRQVVHPSFVEHHAEHDRRQHRAGELGQVEQPQV